MENIRMKSLELSAAPFPKVSHGTSSSENKGLCGKISLRNITNSPPPLWYFENHISILKVHESESVSHSVVSDSL